MYLHRAAPGRHPASVRGSAGSRRRGLPLPIRSTLDSVFFYNKTSINLKGVPVCLGPLTLTGGQEGHSVGSRLAWAGEGCLRGMCGARQSRVSGVLGARGWDEPPQAAVLHCPPGTSVTPAAEKWERAPSHPPSPSRGSWEGEGRDQAAAGTQGKPGPQGWSRRPAPCSTPGVGGLANPDFISALLESNHLL